MLCPNDTVVFELWWDFKRFNLLSEMEMLEVQMVYEA